MQHRILMILLTAQRVPTNIKSVVKYSLLRCYAIARDCLRSCCCSFLWERRAAERSALDRDKLHREEGGLGQVGVLDDTIATCCVPHNASHRFRVTPKTPTDPSPARLAAKFTTFFFFTPFSCFSLFSFSFLPLSSATGCSFVTYSFSGQN